MSNSTNNDAFKVSLASAIVHFVSAAMLIPIFFIMWISAAGTVLVPFLTIIAVLLAFLGIAAFVVFVVQGGCAIGMIVTNAINKRKICAVFCGIPLLVDFPAMIGAAIFGFALIDPEIEIITILLAFDFLLVSVLSLTGAILSIIALVKNLSEK